MPDKMIVDALKHEAQVLAAEQDFDVLVEQIDDASIVLLGEATHGTEEFYRIRARISEKLIMERGFDAIAVEADWPDALRINRYIDAAPSATAGVRDNSAEDSLKGFKRFPLWMWRNTAMADLIGRLRSHNERAAPDAKVGFFGLDLYSLRSSMEAVVQYLSQVDPDAAKQARARYGCFDHMAEDPQRYGYAATFGLKKDCEEEVVRQLVALSEEPGRNLPADDAAALDELFYARQNARVAANAESYYRAMFLGRNESWNQRDKHMSETLDELREHIGRQKGRTAKIIVWAHNSHLGDARATEMGDHGKLNLGQLVREKYGPEQSFLLGFTTHAGTVTAASEWNAPAELKHVRPSMPDSFERLFHDLGIGNFLLPIRNNRNVIRALEGRRLERAIGVIYLPESERLSHYFEADLVRQFDAVIHIDETTALHALDHTMQWQHDEMPDTYPSGM